MSYTPTTWATGDTITADKLNHMEDGIADATSGGGGGSDLFIVNIEFDNLPPSSATLDKTQEEILQAVEDGKIPVGAIKSSGSVIGYAPYENQGGTTPIFNYTTYQTDSGISGTAHGYVIQVFVSGVVHLQGGAW